MHSLQKSSAAAEKAIAFLASLGCTLQDRWVTGGDSFREGWRLTFCGPQVEVIVQYMDLQFEVHFKHADVDATYLELDRDLFNGRSGFRGDMFPPEKLDLAIARIADDVRRNYGPLLSGDEDAWQRIAQLKRQLPRQPRLP